MDVPRFAPYTSRATPVSEPTIYRPEAVLRREPTARRMVRWRIRLILFGLADFLIAILIVAALLPERVRVAGLTIVCMVLIVMGALPVVASTLQYLLVGLHGVRRKYGTLKPYYPNVAVIVPAWNEGKVVGRTIEHLLAMEYPPERLRIVLVDDASTDETPEIGRAKEREHPDQVIYLRRARGGEGKSHTLNVGIERVLGDSWAQAVLVMDADVLFERDALRKMTRHLSDPKVGAVTAYIKEGTHNGNFLTRFIAFEYITAQAVGRRAQNMLGVLGCLAGGAQLHARDSLEAIGGRIDTSSLAEDTVTTFRTQLAGRRVEFEGNAVVWAEEPSDLGGLWKQRMRWSRGNVQVSLQYLSLWGKLRSRFGRLARAPFLLLWFTVLLMPLTMAAAATGLLTLYWVNAPAAWAALRVLWIWSTVVYVYSTFMALATDWRTARRCWLEAVLFPGLVSLVIMAYSVFPAAFDVYLVGWLQSIGLPFTPALRTGVVLFMYAWLVLCIPLAQLAKRCADSRRFRWLAPPMIYLVGYGPFLCAVTFNSYLKELKNAGAIWEKTNKTGRAMLNAGLPL